MPHTDTDLTRCSDAELDAALAILYREHRDADEDDRLTCHLAIIEILAEQSTRLETWRRERAVAG